MSCGIDPACEAAENNQPTCRQVTRQTLCHASPIRSWVTGPNHGDSGLQNCLHVSAHIENQGRIVDLLQVRRKGRVIEGNDLNLQLGRASQFLLSEFHGSPSTQCLGGTRLYSSGFQFSEGRPKNCFYSAEVVGNAAGSRWSYSGCKC